MEERSKPAVVAPVDLDLIGGDPALNFINTLRAKAGSPLETLQADRDVLAWMKKSGLAIPAVSVPLPTNTLLESARALRRIALTLVEQKKAGRKLVLTPLNRYLSQASSHSTLHIQRGVLAMRRTFHAESAGQSLAPVAESIAYLLVTADFDRIRQCAGAGCVLWFSDRPNGRQRRFCVEAACGTRTRVAAYRARRAQVDAGTPP